MENSQFANLLIGFLSILFYFILIKAAAWLLDTRDNQI